MQNKLKNKLPRNSGLPGLPGSKKGKGARVGVFLPGAGGVAGAPGTVLFGVQFELVPLPFSFNLFLYSRRLTCKCSNGTLKPTPGGGGRGTPNEI